MMTLERTQTPKQSKETTSIKKVVIVGGPCGGKTTVLDRLETHPVLKNKYLIVPEAATLLLPGFLAVKAESVTREHSWQEHLQRAIIAAQLGLEATYEDHAIKNRIPLLICDRGLKDAQVYTASGSKILEHEFGIDAETANATYDGVVHLESLAVAAPHLYSKSNNQQRYETAREAREVEARALEVWSDHPNRLVLTGSHLDYKCEMAAAFILRTLEESV